MKKWWLFLVVVVLVALAATVGSFRLNAHEFSFLDRFHPQVTMIEAKSPGFTERRYYYFFERQNSEKVLLAMERELVSSKGYVRKVSGGPAKIVSFSRRSGRGYIWASYHSSNSPMMLTTREGTFRTPPGGCTVWINREPTWLERQIDACKRLF